MSGVMDFFLNVSKAAPVLATQLKQQNDEDKAKLAGSAAVAANTAKARSDGYRKAAVALAQKDPAKADAYNAQADRIDALLPMAVNNPQGFLDQYAALPPMTLAPTVSQVGQAILGDPTSARAQAPAPTVLTDTAGAAAVADVGQANQTEDYYRGIAQKLITDQTVPQEIRDQAQAYLNKKSTDTSFAAKFSNKAVTIQDFNAALKQGDARVTLNFYNSLSAEDKAKINPATVADLTTSANNARTLEGFGVTSAGLSVQSQLLNIKTGTWDLEKSQAAWANTLTLQGQEKDAKLRGYLNEWTSGGNWEAIQSVMNDPNSKADLARLGYTPEMLAGMVATSKGNADQLKQQLQAKTTIAQNEAAGSAITVKTQGATLAKLESDNELAAATDKTKYLLGLANQPNGAGLDTLRNIQQGLKNKDPDYMKLFPNIDPTSLDSMIKTAQQSQTQQGQQTQVQAITIANLEADSAWQKGTRGTEFLTNLAERPGGAGLDTLLGIQAALNAKDPAVMARFPGMTGDSLKSMIDRAQALKTIQGQQVTEGDNRLTIQTQNIASNDVAIKAATLGLQLTQAQIDQAKVDLKKSSDPRAMIDGWIKAGSVEMIASLTPEDTANIPNFDKNAALEQTKKNRANNDRDTGNRLTAQELSIQGQKLTNDGQQISNEGARAAIDQLKTKQLGDQRTQVLQWADGGQVEVLKAMTDQELSALGFTTPEARDALRTRAQNNRTLLDQGRQNVLDGQKLANQAGELNLETGKFDLDKSKQNFVDAQAAGDVAAKEKLQTWIDSGNVEALNSLTPDQWTKYGLDKTSSLARATSNRSIADRSRNATVSVQETNADQLSKAAASADKIRGLTDATAKAQEIGKLADNGKIGLDQLDILLKEGKITQAEYDAGKVKAVAVQGSNDIARDAADFQNKNLVGQAQQQYLSIMLKQEVSNAQDVATISNLGDAGVPALTRLRDAGKLSPTEYQIAVNNARDSQNDLNTARDQKARSVGEQTVASWVDKGLTQATIKPDEWAKVKQALGLTDAGLSQYLAKKKAVGETTAKYEANQRARGDAQSQLDLWVKAGVKPSATEMARVGNILGIGAAGVNQAIQRGVNDRAAQTRQQALQEKGQALQNAKTAADIANAKRELDAQIRRVNADIANLKADNDRQSKLVDAQIANAKAKTPGSQENKLAVDSINKYAKGKRDTAAKLRTQANVLRNSKDTFGNVDPKYLALANAKDAEAATLETEAGVLSQQAISLATTGDPNSVAQPATPDPQTGTVQTPTTPIVIGKSSTYPPLENDGGGTSIRISDGQATKAQADAAQISKLDPNNPQSKTTLDNIVKSWLTIAGFTDTLGNRNAILQWLRKFAK